MKKFLQSLKVLVAVLFVFLGVVLKAQTPLVLYKNTIATTPNASNDRFTLLDKGSFLQTFFQSNVTNSSSWAFHIGTTGSPDYSSNWRPNTSGNVMSMNTYIPTSFANGAKYTNNGGSDGGFNVTNNFYYTWNVTKIGSNVDQVMQVLETSFAPVTVTLGTQYPPTNANITSAAGVKVTVNTSSAPSSGENVYVRYSTDNFVNSTIVAATFTGTLGTATIPALPAGSVVQYYFYSSNKTKSDIDGDVVTYSTQNVHDMSTLNLSASGTYTVSAPLPIQVAGTTGVSAGATYNYPSLTLAGGAFAAINAGTHTGSITVGISGDVTTETGATALNASGGSSSYTTITINPIGARTISGSVAAPLIDFNGADNVTIDGFNTGVNSLTISNTSTVATSGTSTVRFIGGATNNKITNCSVLGSSTMAVGTNGGNIYFATDANTTAGNDNNTISNCNIGPAGLNLPSKGVYFNGSTTSTPINNSGNVVTGNNFIDIFNGAVASAGIYSNTGSTANSFTNNKFYQTGSRVFTANVANVTIQIANTTSGAGFTITGNTIGYGSNTSTGTYTMSGSAGLFRCISFSGLTGGTVSDISNNTISNISLSGVTSSGTGTGSPFMGIFISNGVATTNNNIIGSQTTTGSLLFSTTTTTATDVYGFYNVGSDNWISNGNQIGGINVTNLGASGTFILSPMRANTSSTATWTANNNLIGGTIANSLQLTSTGAASQVIGMSNITPIGSFTSNNIRNLTNNNGTGTTSGASVIGISVTSTANQTISQNTIFNLSNTNTSAPTIVTGIQFTGSTANVVEKNLIYGLISSTNSTSAEINGIRVAGGTTIYKNNIIALGVGVSNSIGVVASNGSTAGINGFNGFLGTDSFWNNSIYIGGTATSGVGASYAFNGTQTSNTRNFQNNIFVNARTNIGATGKHYAIKINGSTINPTGLNLNYNVYNIGGTGGVFGFFNGADRADLSAWQTAVGQDANSLSGDPQYVAPAAIIPDLHINATNPTPVEASGVNIANVTDDFDGQTRSGLTPTDIGADAGNFVSSLVACVAPTAQATAFTPGTNTSTSIAGSFTAATGTPTGYLVVRSPGALSANPADGSTYAAGATLGNGTVIQASNALTFSAATLISNTAYTITIFSYNSGSCSGGPKYLITTPLTGTLITCPAAPTAFVNTGVTSSGATISWSAGTPTGTAATINYTLEVYTNSGYTTPITGSPFAVGTPTTFILNNTNAPSLLPSTPYYYRIKANNGACDSGYLSGGTFTTLCANSSLPLSEGFNTSGSAVFPTCWSQQFVSGTSNITFQTNTSNPTVSPQEGPRFVSWNSYSYSSGQETRLVSPPITTTGTSNVDVNFQWFQDSGQSAALTEGVQIQYSLDGVTWTDSGSFIPRYNATVTGWQPKTVTLPAGAGNQPTIFVGFKFHSTFGNNCSMDAAKIVATPNCITPTLTATTPIGSTTATINWTAPSPAPASGYNYEIRTSGAAGSGATGLTTSGSVGAGVTTANITGLTAATTYSVYVRSNCGVGGTSAWTAAGNFVTLCNVAAITQSEGFNSATIPTCWSTQIVALQTGTKLSYPTTGSSPTTSPQSGSNMVQYNSFSSTFGGAGSEERLLSLPMSSIGTTSVDVEFYFNRDSSYSTSADGVQLQYSLNGTSWTDAGAFIPRYSSTVSGWEKQTVTIPAAIGNQSTFFVAFKFHSEYGGNMFLDDVTVRSTPTCFPPTVTATTPIATTTATINWTAPSPVPANGYNYEIRTSGAGGSGATGLTTSGNVGAGILTANVTGLSAATAYSVYVQSNCGVGVTSSWSVAGTFTTACAVPNNPGAIAVSGKSSTGFTLTYAAASPAPSSYIIFYSVGTTATAIPSLVAGTSYTNGQTYNIGGNNYICVSNNSVSPQGLTGGVPNTQYNYFVFSKSTTNACFGNPYYSSGVAVSVITCPAAPTAPVVSSLTTTSATVSWTASAVGGNAAPINNTLEVYTDAAFTTPIAGSPFTTGTATTQALSGLNPATPYFYRIKANNTSCDSSYLTGSFTTACIGAVITATPGDRCGTGSVALSVATDVAATVDWYSAATGGTSLFTGNIFNTPSISDTTDYFAEASILGSTITGARTAPANISNTTPTSYGLVFDANASFQLTSVDVFNGTTSSGTFVIQLQNSAGTVLYTSSTFTAPAGTGVIGTTVPYTANLGWPIPAGTNYRILVTSGTASLVRESSLGGFPYSVGSFASITSGYVTGPSSNYYYLYNWKVKSTCVTSPRTKVTATINPQPTAISISEIPMSTGASTACDLDVKQLTASGGTVRALSPTPLLNEEFTTTTGTTLPTGWLNQGADIYTFWQGFASNAAGGTPNEMYLNASGALAGDSGTYALRSPSFNSGIWSGMTLNFKSYLDTFDTTYPFTIKVQTSLNGTLWTDRWTYTPTANGILPAQDVSVNLSALDGQSVAYVRFALLGKPYGLNDWSIDNVNITGKVPTQQPITWSPAAGLFTDAALTTAYNAGDNALTVYAAPNAPQQYTATALPGTCQAQKLSTVIEASKKTFTGLATLVADQVLWNVADNWSFKQVPTINKCVVIPTGFNVQVNTPLAVAKTVTVDTGGKLTINANQSLNVKETFTNNAGETDVMIESDGNLIQENDAPTVANSGRISAKRVVTIRDNTQYNYLMSPLIDMNLKTKIYENAGTFTDAPLTLYHQENNNKFYSSIGTYIKGRGLAVKEPGTPTTGNINAYFKGVPLNGAFTYALANSNSGGSTTLGYNLTGNPYPSNIDIVKLYNLGINYNIISQNFYFWDNTANAIGIPQGGSNYNGAAYAVFNAVSKMGNGAGFLLDPGTPVDSRKPTNFVKVGQGFMVQAIDNNQSLAFNNSIRVGDGGNGYFGNPSKAATDDLSNRFWLNLSAPTNLTTQIGVVYFDAGNNAFAKDDSEMNGLPSDVLYSVIEDKKALINGRSTFIDTDKIPLGSNNFGGGNYTFSLAEHEGIFATDQNIYLKDKQTGIMTNLSAGNYTFTANAGESTGRFEIVYKPETVLTTAGTTKENLIVYRDGGDFVVKAQSKKITSLEVFDTAGRLILTLNPNSIKAVIPAEKIVNGVYVLKINQNGQITSKKIIR